jgi:hypothetical protein
MTDVELRENLCSVLYSAFDNDVIIGRVNMSCTNEEKYRCAHVALEHAVDIPIESIIRSLENKRHDIGKLNLSFWVCDQPARPEPDVRKNKSERGKKKKRLMEDEEPPRRQPGRRERTDPFPKEKWWL